MFEEFAVIALALFIFFFDIYRIFMEKQIKNEGISYLFAPVFLLSSYVFFSKSPEIDFLSVASLALMLTMSHILVIPINWWYFVEKHKSKTRFRFFACLGSLNLLLVQLYGAVKNFLNL